MKRTTLKKLAIAMSVLAAGSLLAYSLLKPGSAAAVTDTDTETMRTVSLEKTSLNDTVEVKGTIKSEESSSVTPTISAKIVQLNVKVGDTVKKGDVIAVLDSSDIKDETEKKQKEISQEKQNLKTAFERLTKSQEEAGAHKKQVEQEQSQAVSAAQSALNTAQQAVSSYTSAYNSAKSLMEQADREVKSRQDEFSRKDAELQTAYTAWLNAGMPASGTEKDAYDAAQTAQSSAKSELDNARTIYGYEEKQKNWQSASDQMNTLNSALADARTKLDSANAAKVSALQSEDKTISDLNDQASDALKKIQNDSSSDSLKDLSKKMDETILKAETSGKVTELKATVGSVPKDTIAVIQSSDKLIMEATVQTYDISKVKVGQKAVVKTGSGDETVEGTVQRIAPTATSDDSGSGFTVEIKINDPSKVYAGTKVNAEIIISEKNNVYTVPKDALSSDGTRIKVKQSDGSFQDVTVQTGDSNAYNTEISGSQLKEGMEVLSVYEWETLKQTQAQKSEESSQ